MHLELEILHSLSTLNTTTTNLSYSLSDDLIKDYGYFFFYLGKTREKTRAQRGKKKLHNSFAIFHFAGIYGER